VYWAFLAFVFSIPIEGFKLGPLTLSKISGLLFFAVYFVFYNPALSHIPGRKSFPRWPAPLWGFAIYLAIWILHGLAVPDLIPRLLTILFTLVQLVLIFWIASGLLRNRELARHSVVAFAGSTLFLACAMLMHLPGFYDVVRMPTGPRVSALGYNPNTLGVFLALGAVGLIGLRLNPVYKHWASKSALLISVIPVLVAMIQTGSRTAVVICSLGIVMNVAATSQVKNKGVTWMLIAVIALGFGYLVLKDASMSARLDNTLTTGSMAGRENIFAIARSMILQKPLLGWHPVEMWHQLALRVGGHEERDAHNLYLHLFLEVGAVGALPFLFGLGWCGWIAWRCRTDHLGLVPFSLWLVVVVGNMAGTDYLMKSFWYVLALTCAIAPVVAANSAQQASFLLASRPGNHTVTKGYVPGKILHARAPVIPLSSLKGGKRRFD
jgi:O-antigen ligase